jgi:streptogramin lyase
MYDARELTVEQIGQVLGVSRTTNYRALGSKAFAAAAAAEAAPSLAAPTPTPASTLTPVPVGHATKPVAPAAALRGQWRRGGSGAAGRYDAWAIRVDRR